MSALSLALLPLIPLGGAAFTVGVMRAVFGPRWAS